MTFFLEKPKNLPVFCKAKICWSGKVKRSKKADRDLYFYFTFSKKEGWWIKNRSPKSDTLFCIAGSISIHITYT